MITNYFGTKNKSLIEILYGNGDAVLYEIDWLSGLSAFEYFDEYESGSYITALSFEVTE